MSLFMKRTIPLFINSAAIGLKAALDPDQLWPVTINRKHY